MNSIELDIDEDERPQNELNNNDDDRNDDEEREETGANEKGKNADNNQEQGGEGQIDEREKLSGKRKSKNDVEIPNKMKKWFCFFEFAIFHWEFCEKLNFSLVRSFVRFFVYCLDG